MNGLNDQHIRQPKVCGMNEQSIFLAAMEITDPHQRAAYLDQACAGDPSLRQQVDALFVAHERSGEFLDVPALKQMAGVSGAPNPGGATSVERHASQGDIDLSFLQPSTVQGSLGRLMHYEVREVIGRGGCGIVLKAFDEKLQRIVAIKIMAPELAATSPARKRFLREARATAAIRNENVVSIHAVEEQPLPFLVMEYIDGPTLQQKLDQTGPLDLQEVLRIGRQIATGLEAAHAKGLIHRDIKPGNILLEDGTGHVKITDFGLARSADDASMTQSGVITGTPLYMSPEQAQAHHIDHRSDLFSLGSVLYVMCSGRPPFRAASILAVMKRVVEDQPRPIEGIIPEVPDWFVAIIAKLHAKNPEERFASAQDIRDLLARCQSELEQTGRVASVNNILPKIPQPANVAQEPVQGDSPKSEARTDLESASRPARARGRNWAAAAAIILVLLAGLGLTEATGVTNVRGTVIHLFSPGGTLMVEVDDPGVSVTIDGEDLVITGTGAKEIRLKPGQYTVLASKDGEVVRRELVTVTRNGRQAVRVELLTGQLQARQGENLIGQQKLPSPDEGPAIASDTDAPPTAVAPFDAEQAKQHQQEWADYLGVPVEQEIIVGKDEDGQEVALTMVLIPPGEFMMGSSEEERARFLEEARAGKESIAIIRIPSEGPQHRVRITRPFYLGKYEVTQAQWQAVLGNNPSQFKDNPMHPVEQVSWNDIQLFLAKVNEGGSAGPMEFALPTEAQWEYACRAGTTGYWHSGDSEDGLQHFGWHRRNSGGKTHPVGELRSNRFGLYDMHNNVWEWCADWYTADYYAKSPVDDPTGPSADSRRVLRGGGWGSHPRHCRSAYRYDLPPGLRHYGLGFRVMGAMPL
jgi:eukaryotic-like serine/threonine-protein kinase